MDIGTIGAAVTSLKSATDIVKFLRDSNVSLEKAEFKLKLADLMEALADARMQIAEVQDALIEKDKQISALQDALESKETLMRYEDAYYEIGSNGNPNGRPLCINCWEGSHKKRHLVSVPGDRFSKVCPSCSRVYSAQFVRELGRPPQLG